MSQETNTIEVQKIVFPAAYQIEFAREEWKAEADEGHVLVRTDYTLISPGTELALYTGAHIDLPNPSNRWAKFPFYPGYASVGEVMAIGSGVSGVQLGEIVLTMGHHASHEMIPYNPDRIFKLPDGLSPKKALFSVLAEISMSSLIHSRFKAGDCVVVIGMGMIGNFAAQLYALQGAKTIGVDLSAGRLEAARASNIEHVVRPIKHESISEAIKQLNGGEDPHIVVEATGNPQLINSALELVRPHGQVILLGSPRGKVEINAYKHIHSKGAALIGAHGNIKGIDGLPTSAQLIRYMLQLISNHMLKVDPLFTHVLPPSEIQTGYDLLLDKKDEALGIVLDWKMGVPR